MIRSKGMLIKCCWPLINDDDEDEDSCDDHPSDVGFKTKAVTRYRNNLFKHIKIKILIILTRDRCC